MGLIPYKFNDFILNGKQIKSSFIDPYLLSLGSSTVKTAQISQSFPIYAGKTLSEREINVEIVLECPNDQRGGLAYALNSYDTNEHLFYSRETSTGKLVYLYATCTGLVCDDRIGEKFTATLVAVNPIWKSVDLHHVTSTLNATPKTVVYANDGNQDAFPNFELKLNTQRSGGLPYRKYVTILSNFTADAVNYPVDVTGGGLDTATEVSAGRMQASGNDLVLLVNGLETQRFIDPADMNTNHTRVWGNFDLSKRPTFVLNGAMNNVDDYPTLVVTPIFKTVSGKKVYTLEDVSQSGILMIDTEQFTYTGVNVKTGTFTGVTRAVRDTSKASHLNKAVIKQVPYDVVLAWGDSTRAAPDIDDDKIPCINLLTSSNTSHVYNTFGSIAGEKPLAFLPSTLNLTTDEATESTIYTATQYGDADPFTVMGARLASFYKAPSWKAANGILRWDLYHPAGVTHVSSSGKYFRLMASWPGTVALQKTNTSSWKNQWNLATPGSANTWLTWTKNGENLGGTYKKLAFVMNGTIAAAADNSAGLEVSALTLTLDSTKTPTVTLGPMHTDTYYVDMTVENVTTGEHMYLKFPLVVGQTIVIDQSNRIAYCKENNINLIGGVTKDSARDRWLRIIPGNNTLKFSEAGIVNVGLVSDYPDRFN